MFEETSSPHWFKGCYRLFFAFFEWQMSLFRFPASCHTPDGNISSPVLLSIRSVPLSLSNKHPPTYEEYTGRSHRTKKREASFSHKVRIVTFPHAANSHMLQLSKINQGERWYRIQAYIFVSKIWDFVIQTETVRWTRSYPILTAAGQKQYQLRKKVAGSAETPDYHLQITSSPPWSTLLESDNTAHLTTRQFKLN